MGVVRHPHPSLSYVSRQSAWFMSESPGVHESVDPIPFLGGCRKKAAMVEVSISLAFLYWVPIALHPCRSFISDATFVLKKEC